MNAEKLQQLASEINDKIIVHPSCVEIVNCLEEVTEDQVKDMFTNMYGILEEEPYFTGLSFMAFAPDHFIEKEMEVKMKIGSKKVDFITEKWSMWFLMGLLYPLSCDDVKEPTKFSFELAGEKLERQAFFNTCVWYCAKLYEKGESGMVRIVCKDKEHQFCFPDADAYLDFLAGVATFCGWCDYKINQFLEKSILLRDGDPKVEDIDESCVEYPESIVWSDYGVGKSRSVEKEKAEKPKFVKSTEKEPETTEKPLPVPPRKKREKSAEVVPEVVQIAEEPEEKLEKVVKLPSRGRRRN